MSQYFIKAAGTGGAPIEVINGNTGSASPAAGIVNIVGGNNINTVGSGNTLTVNVSGTTQNALLIGNATGSITSLAAATNGQIPIGNTGNPPTLGTITPGAGIQIGVGAGSITVRAIGGGFTWNNQTTNTTMAINNAYQVTSGTLSLALPSTAGSTLGDSLQIILAGGTSFTITQAAGQQIRLGSTTSTVGVTGTVAPTAQGDWIELVYSTGGLWYASAREGNFTVL